MMQVRAYVLRSLWGVGAWLAAAAAWAQFPPVELVPLSQQELVSPVGITNAGDGSNRMFVIEQRGEIRVFDSGGNLLPEPFLDLGSKLVDERAGYDERGLLGLAFHPNFGQEGMPGSDKFYVYYSAPRPGGNPDDPVSPVDHQSILAEYSVTGPGSNVADPNSERILLSFDEPQFNHNAGFLGFGPDNLLYITTGDGGGGGDNEPGHTGGGTDDPSGGLGNAQDLSKYLGKVLRIDPLGNSSSNGQYGIPADNPFVGQAGALGEIYAYGFRNPWRATFDDGPGGTGDMIIADVGQNAVEEVDILQPGGNYGWRIKEGTFDFDPSVTPDPDATLIDPIAEYAHPGTGTGLPEIGLSISGGVVYRGDDFPELQGKYIFGDWSRGFGAPAGTLLGLDELVPGAEPVVLDVVGGNPLDEYILSFGTNEQGDILVATTGTLGPSQLDDNGLPTGAIYRIQAVPEPASLGLSILALLALVSGLRCCGRGARRPAGV